MLLPYALLFLPALAATQEPSRSITTLDHERMLRGAGDSLDWIGKNFLGIVDALLPASKSRGAEGNTLTVTNVAVYDRTKDKIYTFSACVA